MPEPARNQPDPILAAVKSTWGFDTLRPLQHDADAVWEALVADSVLVRNCASWPGLHNCLRVTIGTPDEDDRFLDALRKALA